MELRREEPLPCARRTIPRRDHPYVTLVGSSVPAKLVGRKRRVYIWPPPAAYTQLPLLPVRTPRTNRPTHTSALSRRDDDKLRRDSPVQAEQEYKTCWLYQTTPATSNTRYK